MENIIQTKDRELIDQIKEIRAKNNSPWMEMFKIALELDRKRALVYAKQILENDAEINRLLKTICEEDDLDSLVAMKITDMSSYLFGLDKGQLIDIIKTLTNECDRLRKEIDDLKGVIR